MIAGYSTQENSSLMFNNLPEIIHSRCDGLKINIQLKILHATIPVQLPEMFQESPTGNPAAIIPQQQVLAASDSGPRPEEKA